MSSRAQKKSATRALLIDAAARLFAERGIEATTMDDIARQAGTSRTSVFNYFGYKEMLLCEVGRRLLDEVPRTADGSGRTPESDLRALGDGIADVAARHPRVLAALARELTHPDVERRRTALKRTGLRSMIDRAVGELATGDRLRNPAARAAHVRQLIDLIAGPIVRAGGEFPADRLRTEMRRNVELFMEGATLPRPARPGEMVAIPIAPVTQAAPTREEAAPAGLRTRRA